MKNLSIFAIVSLLMMGITLTSLWAYAEDQNAYSEPYEAILAEDNGLLLIPAYKTEEKSLYFFMKNKHNLGAVYAHEGFFGWKSGMLTWGPITPDRKFDRLEGIKGHGENLIYGLINKGEERIVKVDDENATILYLSSLSPEVVKEYDLEGVSLWYFEKDPESTYNQVQLVEKEGDEVIQSIDL
ncbi:aspartyl-tRNA synthetase [Bacillus sp. AFS015802]|uniref:aspartyl-tRNA synthetase n=1 Tax=Bacillus sp. AFS015802 TaxID=2033486 RepID=UPI000BF2C4F1|nr:aspartyl-tRNA synthetase [Bacillus sp. AFS015802]PFA63065.1 aspartyl-tRNA synthetase [Bacillus sp. AFS015802]